MISPSFKERERERVGGKEKEKRERKRVSALGKFCYSLVTYSTDVGIETVVTCVILLV